MGIKNCYTLQIDREFRNLIQPSSKSAYHQLEKSIILEGCKEPIITCHGVILDGYKRYEICQRNSIPFSVSEMDFQYREESVSWICANQLKRADITEEARKFLIGMQYETEKILKRVVKENYDQYTDIPNNLLSPARLRGRIAEPIAKANNISYGTVLKYAEYTRALEEVGHKVPELVSKILSGRFKISQRNLVELSLLNKEQIKRMARYIEQEQQPYIHYKQTRQEIQRRTAGSVGKGKALPSVKDMPSFDPDAEIAGLTLTIPSWSGSIDRIRKITNLSIVSSTAKAKLKDSLLGLQTRIEEMLSAIKED